MNVQDFLKNYRPEASEYTTLWKRNDRLDGFDYFYRDGVYAGGSYFLGTPKVEEIVYDEPYLWGWKAVKAAYVWHLIPDYCKRTLHPLEPLTRGDVESMASAPRKRRWFGFELDRLNSWVSFRFGTRKFCFYNCPWGFCGKFPRDFRMMSWRV